MPAQPDNTNASQPAAVPSAVAPPAAPDPVAQQSRISTANKSSAHYLFRSRRKDEESSIEPQPSPLTSSTATTADSPDHHQIDQPGDESNKQFTGPPEKLQAAKFKDMPAFDIVALARATGKTYTEVLENYLREPLQRRREFILANAPFMKEKEILGCIEQLPPEERPPILMSLSPFIRSRAGKIAFARHVEEIRVPPAHEGKPAEYLRRHHEAKQEPVLGALRDVDDPKAIIKQLPTKLRTNAKWVMNVRQLEGEMRSLQALDHDGQLTLLKKVEACITGEKAEFAGYIDGLLRTLSAQWETLPLENRALALRLIGALSTRNKKSTTGPTEQRKHLENLLDELVTTPHSPVLQKDIVRMVKAFCKQDDGPEQNRIALLKKLGNMGSELHAASTFESRTGYNVQRYAYNLFKQELKRLSLAAKGEVAAHWAKQSVKWDAASRSLSKNHWKHFGHATDQVPLSGSTTRAIAISASLPEVTARAECIAAPGEATPQSPINSRPIVVVVNTSQIEARHGQAKNGTVAANSPATGTPLFSQQETDWANQRWNLRHHCREHGCGTHCRYTNRVCVVEDSDARNENRCRCARCSRARVKTA